MFSLHALLILVQTLGPFQDRYCALMAEIELLSGLDVSTNALISVTHSSHQVVFNLFSESFQGLAVTSFDVLLWQDTMLRMNLIMMRRSYLEATITKGV
ncbi:uncharacterized protein EAE97_010539 [Botrytis byssoidea]|uniref:Secreted protein n=1 Tax=Botrytis byssoidea TaxID=139641 RepID=A0A9P5I151_9HELO|nr:uncharacterized protein EAE97_010539 [Botrytis byssoidea]KAF7925458.1 hypothetical protein EAE97_010539 [Botrytis byssoidea]